MGSKEGFSTYDENTNYIPYFKEVFLVAPDQWGNANNYVGLYTAINNPVGALSYRDAAATCANISGPWGVGQLATLDQLTKATNRLGADWCPGGWVKDDTSKLYYPMQKNGTCGIASDLSGVKNITPYTGNLGYAVCYAVKPPNVPIPTPYIRDFSHTDYSMVGAAAINFITAGNGADLYPLVFSISQAYWALEQNGYDIAKARDALKISATRLAYDAAILSAIGGKPLTDVQKTTDTSCADLLATKTDFETKIGALKTSFSDLSGAVYSAIAAKSENTNYIQSQITSICGNPNISQVTADACARLMSLDYDIFYKNKDPSGETQQTLLADIENINIALATDECQLQSDFGSLKVVMDSLNCPATDWTILKDNTMGGIPIKCSDDPTYRATIPATAFRVGPDLQGSLEAVEILKNNLQQISPYFNVDKYSSLMNSILNQLSVTMRTPLKTEYMDSESAFKRANSYAQRVYNMLLG